MTLVLVAAIGVAFVVWRIQRVTPFARPAAVSPQATAGRCHHYFRKAFADRWVCAECGHTVEVTTADDMNAIEAWANGEAL